MYNVLQQSLAVTLALSVCSRFVLTPSPPHTTRYSLMRICMCVCARVRTYKRIKVYRIRK